MKNIVRFSIVLIVCTVGVVLPDVARPLSSVVFAQTLESLLTTLPDDLRSELLETGSVSRYFEDHDNVALLPDHSLNRVVTDTLSRERPNVISEQILLLRTHIGARERLDLYNSLRRVSTLSHIQYHNERKDTWHELFEQSYAVDGPRERHQIEDPVVARIPDDDSVWALQVLPPFGTVLSEYRYRADGEAFLFSGTNEDPLFYRNVRVVRPGNMTTFILVVPGDDFLLVYGLGGVRAFMMFGLLDDRIEAAFSGRTEGLFRWYDDNHLSRLVP